MTAPIYAAALVVSVCVGYSSDHFNEKPFHVLGATIIAGISFIITATVPNAAVKYTFILFVSLHLPVERLELLDGAGLVVGMKNASSPLSS